MANEPISIEYFMNPSHQSASVCVPPTIAKQRLGKDVTAATETHAAIEDLLDVYFCMRSVSYYRKVGDLFFPELAAMKYAMKATISRAKKGYFFCLLPIGIKSQIDRALLKFQRN
jgi:hypothetical protein